MFETLAIHWNADPVLLSLGSLEIRWYSLLFISVSKPGLLQGREHVPGPTDGRVQQTLIISILYTADHGLILRMFQIQPNEHQFGFVQPGFSDREVDQPALFYGRLEEGGSVQFMGLEVVVECIQNNNLFSKINIQEILIQ